MPGTMLAGLAAPLMDAAIGNLHSCVVTTKGVVQCWGINAFGEFGNGKTVASRLTQQDVTDRHGNLTQNPLFKDLNPNDDNSAVRDPSLVFIAGIVGVPWQDIARRDDNGQPDLLNGLDAEGRPVGGFQSGTELMAGGTWDVILGDPSCYTSDPAGCQPSEARMIEHYAFRPGLPGPGSADPVHGHEWTIGKDDLQYACIFPLIAPRDCLVEETCDCKDPSNDNPLCEPSPGDNAHGTTQYGAKAYPGVRELSVLRALTTQGIVGSICPEQLSDGALSNFGYRPAINTIVEQLKQALTGKCMSRSLTPDPLGQVACKVFEARNDANCEAACNGAGRAPLAADDPAVNAAKQDPLYQSAQWSCFCEIVQLTGDELSGCQNDPADPPLVNNQPIHGWCYIDAAGQPPVGNPALVASCPETEQRIIRFVGNGTGAPGATLFITCSGE